MGGPCRPGLGRLALRLILLRRPHTPVHAPDRRPLFPGKSEPEQLALIFSLLGSPAADDAAAGPGAYTAWPNFFKPPADSRLPHVAALAPKEHFERRIEQKYPPSGRMSHEALALIARLLLCEPEALLGPAFVCAAQALSLPLQV